MAIGIFSSLTGNETLQVTGITASGLPSGQSGQCTTAQIAALAASGGTPTIVSNNLTTVGAGTLTAALLVGRLINRSGPIAAFTDTTDTAANIIASLPAVAVVGESFEIIYVNTTVYPATLAGGTSVTFTAASIAGPIPSNCTARILLTYATATTITLQVIEVSYNTAGGYDPSTIQTQFGSGSGTFLEEGNIFKYASAGMSPAATNADIVLQVYSLPANSFDGVGFRELTIQAIGSFANNTNSKRIKIIFNATTAVVGSAVTGGTTLVDTGAYTTTGAVGWNIGANVAKYGTANSNTQIGTSNGVFIGGTHTGAGAGASVPQAITATENAVILIAVTGNAVTTASDILLNMFTINAMN